MVMVANIVQFSISPLNVYGVISLCWELTLRNVYGHISCRLALELLLKWDVGHNNLEPLFTD